MPKPDLQRTAGALLAFALLTTVAVGARAEFLVNNTTLGDQRTPAVASDAQGRFVVVWADDDPTPGYDPEIMGRRFDTDGTALGTEFQISSESLTQERSPKVAVDEQGEFFVVWSAFSDGQFTGIAGRRYAPDGTPFGGGFVVNTYTTASQLTPDVIATGSGSFLVAWGGYGDQDGSGGGVFAQRFDSAGALVNEFQINRYTTGFQREPKLAVVDDAGSFVVVWEELQSYTVVSRLFDASGAPLGSETSLVDPSLPVDVAGLPAGGFVVVWGVGGIYGQRFDRDGNAVGSELTVALDPSLRHAVSPPDVCADDDGSLLVGWDNTEPFVRRFAPDAEPLGDGFAINTYTSGFQGKPVGVSLGGRDFVVVWHSFDQDGAGYGVFARKIDAGPIACSPSPMNGCRSAGAGSLVVRDGSGGRRDILKWYWSSGEETQETALGDPPNTTPYALCLYEDAGLVKSLSAPAATLCAGEPCWRALADGGYRYRDRSRDELDINGGMHKLRLRPGAAGVARLIARGNGEALAPDLVLPFQASATIVVQAVNQIDECWQSVFVAADASRNDATRFKAKN